MIMNVMIKRVMMLNGMILVNVGYVQIVGKDYQNEKRKNYN